MSKKTNILLSVLFGDFEKRYFYVTDDDTIEVGNQVIVPVGDDGTERIVEVEKRNILIRTQHFCHLKKRDCLYKRLKGL